MASKQFIISPNLNSVSTTIEELQSLLIAWKCKSEHVTPSIITIEELLVDIIKNGTDTNKIYLYAKRGLRKTSVTIIYRGELIDIKNGAMLPEAEGLTDTIDPTAEDKIREIMLNLLGRRISSKHSKGVSTIRVEIGANDKAALIDTLTAIVAAIVVCSILRITLPQEATQFVASNIFSPIYAIFLRAMQLIIAPLIFFSLASSVVGLSDFHSLGRTGIKILSAYTLTTFFAIFIAFGIDKLMLPGEAKSIPLPEANAANMFGDLPETSASLKTMFINLVPNNFFGTFVESDMLQVIVLAIVCAATIGHLGQYSDVIKKAIEVLNAFFSTLTKGITSLLPFAIFGSIGSLVLTTDLSSFGSLAYWSISVVIALCAMWLVYCIIILVFARLNPLVFFKKYFKSSIMAFSSASSSVALPTSLECCRNLGISPKVYSFSIPLGCTINMDGYAVIFTSATLFLSRIYGVEIEPSTMLSLATMIMLFSFAMPAVPGSGFVALISLLALIGVPGEALTIVLGLLSLIEMQETATNVLGDGAVTTIIAKSEGELNKEQYYA